MDTSIGGSNMKKLIWIVVSVVLILITLTALTYEKKEERTYGEVVERLYKGEEKVTKLLIETDNGTIEVTDTTIINELLYEHSQMKLIETDELPYINYKINAYVDSDIREFYVAVDVKNKIIYTNSMRGSGTLSKVLGTNELIEILKSLE